MKAKVILRGARTYNLGGKRWIKDVPNIIHDDAIKQYKENGYFYVVILKSNGPKKKKGSKESKPKSNPKAGKPQADGKKKAKLKK